MKKKKGEYRTSEAQRRANIKYDREHAFQVGLKFIDTTEADMIEKLKSVDNKSGYIKSLIRKDIEENG